MEDDKLITISGQCDFIKPSGQRCEAKSMVGSPFCWWHNPEVLSKRLEAQRRGGLARHGITGEPGNYSIRSPMDILQVLQDCLNEVYSLESSASKGKTIAYIAQVILRGFEATSIEERLKALEDRVYKQSGK